VTFVLQLFEYPAAIAGPDKWKIKRLVCLTE